MGDYGQVIDTLYDCVRLRRDSFGLSRSSISNQFIEQSSEKLAEFEKRSLHPYEFVGIFIDGKSLAKEQIIIVLGVSETGEKIPLGFAQSYTENSESIKNILTELIDRGLAYETGLLFIVDGAKGIHKAIKETFGNYAIIQRCQWHKRENIVGYLNKEDQDHYRKRLNKAYQSESYDEAKQKLNEIKVDLEIINLSASRAVKEGMEETLTLHRLGLNEFFGKSFSTTNCIENLNSQLNKYIGKVKYWKTSKQRYRWIASALLEIEKRMRRVNNYKNLYLMKETIYKEIQNKSNKSEDAA